MEEMNIIKIVERLKIGLTNRATGGDFDKQEYKSLRKIIIGYELIKTKIPRFLKLCRTLDEFWEFIKGEYAHYSERRQFLSDTFNEIIYFLEARPKDDNSIFNKDIYKLGDEIGKGGFSVVYKYHHKLLDLDFAVKIFNPLFVSTTENEMAEKRFFREAKMLFSLSNKNIVKIYDIGRIDGKPFIRMELVENGLNMNEFVKKYSTVNYERSKKPITALLKGLNYAHNKGIIHRDLKPSNYMVDMHGNFKIIDFGVSAFLEFEGHTKLTQTGEHVAGGLYIDPCLLENPKLRDVRSDIYSVGAIWFFLLTGVAPRGGGIRNILLKSSNLNNLQANIIMKCLSHDIEDRYNNCEEILNILKPPALLQNRTNSITPGGNNITTITREYIVDYLKELHSDETSQYVYSVPERYSDQRHVFYYSGRKSDIEFLSRLYSLDEMQPSKPKYKSFKEEIFKHTVENDDFEPYWVFDDERLGLRNGEDNTFLRFLSEMFHPEIRQEKCDWLSVLNGINDFLDADGFEIFESDQISKRAVYSYRVKI